MYAPPPGSQQMGQPLMMGQQPQQQQYQQQPYQQQQGMSNNGYNYNNNNNNNNMMMMPQHQSMAPQQPLLWPNGIFITDRPATNPDDCSSPPCWCCKRPVWFTNDNWQLTGKQASQEFGCCKWKIENADVLGQTMTFEGKECCGVKSMCEPEIHISENGRNIGTATMLLPCSCSCGEVDMCLVRDAGGNPKYVRRENICCSEYRYWSGDFCGWQQYRWPIAPAGSEMNRIHPFSHIMFRYHACMPCHPIAVGIDGHDMRAMNVPPEDQKLLVGMALCRWWRAEQDQNKNNNAN